MRGAGSAGGAGGHAAGSGRRRGRFRQAAAVVLLAAGLVIVPVAGCQQAEEGFAGAPQESYAGAGSGGADWLLGGASWQHGSPPATAWGREEWRETVWPAAPRGGVYYWTIFYDRLDADHFADSTYRLAITVRHGGARY